MDPRYLVKNPDEVFSPALLFFKDLIKENLARMIARAGGPQRLRPHVKTHKTREITRLELEAGITKHKCATLAEAEMLASCGVRDVLLSYPLVGPNCGRMARLMAAYPDCRFAALVDHPAATQTLSDVMARAGKRLTVLLDLDVGQHRTGIAPGDAAASLYEQIARLPGLEAGGLHVYDGHNHQDSYEERKALVAGFMGAVLALRARLEKKGLPVPRMIVGGTPSFPVFTQLDLPMVEYSPGTCVLHDQGYGSSFQELADFTPAALVLTRVISRPTPGRVTFDLGTKAVASDPPAGKRVHLLDVPEYTAVLQNEEHLVVETPAAERFNPGDVVLAVPTHICPTCALHRFGYVVEGGRVTERWEIASRDRILSI